MKKPVIAIIGRPNVGKSTLVNRIIGSRKAIVDDLPGVTRDRSYYEASWSGVPFILIDTGGLVLKESAHSGKSARALKAAALNNTDEENPFTDLVNQQVAIALAESDRIVFVVDGQAGLTVADELVAHQIRMSEKPVIIAVNKIDQPHQKDLLNEFYALGFESLCPISAMHGDVGIGNLLDKMTENLSPESPNEDEVPPIRLSLLGRPNVGKSSIFNALLGEDRSIVSPVSGTTRDAIDIPFQYKEQPFLLVDTAGIRKKGKVSYGVELFSVDRSIRAMKNADISIVVLDATENSEIDAKIFVTDQDKKIIEASNDAGKGLIIVINKWDLIEEKTTTTIEKFKKVLFHAIPHARYAPIIFTSALTGQRLTKVLETAQQVFENCNRRHKTNLVNQVLTEAVMLSPPPIRKNKQLNVLYATQVSIGPPTFILFVNDAKLMNEPYKRYLEKKLRESFELTGTPVVIIPRNRNEN